MKHSEAHFFLWGGGVGGRKYETRTIVSKTEGQNLYQGKNVIIILLLFIEVLSQQPITETPQE